MSQDQEPGNGEPGILRLFPSQVLLMFRRDKRRCYIAYYHREPTPELPSKYYTALLITPKNPDNMAVAKQCQKYHVLDRISNDEAIGGHWIYQRMPVYSRTVGLAGILLLGKIPERISADFIDETLRSVPKQDTVAENPAWRCRHWVQDALTVGSPY